MYKLEIILEHKEAREIKDLLIEIPELRGSDIDTLSELTMILFQKLLCGNLIVVSKNDAQNRSNLISSD